MSRPANQRDPRTALKHYDYRRVNVRREFVVVSFSAERRGTRAAGTHGSASGRRTCVDNLRRNVV